MENHLNEILTQTINFLNKHITVQNKPQICLVLGSGFYDFIKNIDIQISIPFNQIPHFKIPQVKGHGKNLYIGFIENISIAILSGRIHLYEGYSAFDIVYPLRSVLLAYKIKKVILTNAAGGINKNFKPLDIIMIKDHINLTAQNCLIMNKENFGEKFINMSDCYSQKWRQKLKLEHKLKEGVYAGVLGPNYETPAETKMLKNIGADMVGMSTVQEAIAAKQLGAKILGLSLIANMACGISKNVNHHEVLNNGIKATNKIYKILKSAIINADI